MNRILRVLCTIISFGAISCSQKSYDDMNVSQFSHYLLSDSNIQLVDVRTESEYHEGHLQGAILIDVKNPQFLTMAQEKLNKQQPVAVYCRSGRRSSTAAIQLAEAGFKVTNLAGGIMAWKSKGQPIVNP